jgi:recombination protein RecA
MKPNAAAASFSTLLSRLGIRPEPHPAQNEWTFDVLAGRFAELSCHGQSAALSAAVSIVLQAQQRGEPAAWVAVGNSTFFPPDVAACGVDLAALPVVCVRDGRAATRAADKLLRSGAFGAVVVDLGHDAGIRVPVQGRLAGLAKRHHAVLLCLTKKGAETPSIGSLVSIRGETRLRRSGFDRFTWEVRVLKDKRRGPGWRHEDTCRGPEGLC